MSPLKLSKMQTWQRATIILSVSCAMLCIIISSHLPERTSLFLYIFSAHDSSASVMVLMLALAAVFCRDKNGKMQSFFCLVARHPNFIACNTFLICASGAWFVYYAHPLSMDEYVAFFQSQIFASGHLLGRLPPDFLSGLVPSPFHDTFLLVNRESGSVASVYWPAQSLVMAPFTFFGMPWLCNPLITGLTFLALNSLLELLVRAPAARGFALFSMLASPVILINGMSYFGMPLQLLCCLMFTLGMIKSTTSWLVAAGFFLALGLSTVNPVPVGLYALPWLAWAIIGTSTRWRTMGWLALLGLPVAAVLGIGWKAFLMENFHQSQQVGLNADMKSMLSVFTLPTLPIIFFREVGLIKIFLWSVPGLPVMACLGCHSAEKWTKLMVASAACLFLGYFFVPFDQGHGWGYRYFHAAWFVLPVLSAVMLQNLSSNLKIREQVYGFAFTAAVGSLVFLTPFRSYQTHSLIGTQLQQIPPSHADKGRQLVFMRAECGFLSPDLIQNDPFLRDAEIRLLSKGYAKDAEIAATIGLKPRLVSRSACGDRWLLDDKAW